MQTWKALLLATQKQFAQFTIHLPGSFFKLANSTLNLIFMTYRQTLFEFDTKQPTKDEDVYHFVGYVPIDGRLYELDGLKEGPIDLGAIPTDSDWIDVARPIIEKRMLKY